LRTRSLVTCRPGAAAHARNNDSFQRREGMAHRLQRVCAMTSGPCSGALPVTAHRAALKEYLTFGLGDDAYAVALADVRELVAGHDVAPIAGTSAFIRGCIELRGKPLVVLDPRVEL